MNVLLLLLLLLDNLPLVDVKLVGILQQFINIVSQASEVLLQYRCSPQVKILASFIRWHHFVHLTKQGIHKVRVVDDQPYFLVKVLKAEMVAL